MTCFPLSSLQPNTTGLTTSGVPTQSPLTSQLLVPQALLGLEVGHPHPVSSRTAFHPPRGQGPCMHPHSQAASESHNCTCEERCLCEEFGGKYAKYRQRNIYAPGHGLELSTSAVILGWWPLPICTNLVLTWKTMGGETKVANLTEARNRIKQASSCSSQCNTFGAHLIL